ncbi:MAG: hypothetical protein M3Y23_00880, partial [Actinomycetota bacterium]|nr:hypothetical protein [Actinomycetota bacterium]
AEEERTTENEIASQEAIGENRFIAARDGVHGSLIDIDLAERRPVAEILGGLVNHCRPHAQELGCEAELEHTLDLVEDSPADRQRKLLEDSPSLAQVVRQLADDLA